MLTSSKWNPGSSREDVELSASPVCLLLADSRNRLGDGSMNASLKLFTIVATYYNEIIGEDFLGAPAQPPWSWCLMVRSPIVPLSNHGCFVWDSLPPMLASTAKAINSAVASTRMVKYLRRVYETGLVPGF